MGFNSGFKGLKIFLTYTGLEMIPRRARSVKQMRKPLYRNNVIKNSVEILRAKNMELDIFLKINKTGSTRFRILMGVTIKLFV